MTIRDTFLDHLSHLDRSSPQPAELLPSRLAACSVEVLPIAGAGISLFSSDDFRVPVGASSDAAADAERLQFTTGQGPCLAAHATGTVCLADEEVMAHTWPQFREQLTRGTRYRAIAAFPLISGLQIWGSVDMFLAHPRDLAVLPLTDATAIAELVGSILLASLRAGPGPGWTDNTAAAARHATMIAIGMLDVALQVSTAQALDILRARAYSTDTTVDALADDLLHRRISPDEFRDDIAHR